jgi:23S rRNA (uracil1939-C5)-methyltransferase
MIEDGALTIVRLGAQGDGIAETPDGPRFLPFALPGERVRESSDGKLEILSPPSPDRVAPVCRHFGICGGCVAQHMRDDLYSEWKRGIVVEAFRQRGLAPKIASLARVPTGSRRRAVLTAHGQGPNVTLGYHRRRSHDLFDLEECPVLQPGIVAAVPGLRALAGTLAAREARITALATPAGLDVAIEAKGTRPVPRTAALLARGAAQHRLARLTLNGDAIAERAAPDLPLGVARVRVPPGAFVQAVEAAQDVMVRLVTEATTGARRVADLFCGVGTFSLALARTARVLAVDHDSPSLAALDAAARHTQGLKPIETKARDLFREPLSAKELAGFDALVFDPARAGARAQAAELAHAKAKRIVAVSCNPATLAADVRLLVDGGYRIEEVTPIDQFLYSHHVEAVAVLTR